MSTSRRALPQIVAVYDYHDETGALLFQAVRYEPGFDGEGKTFRQRRPFRRSHAWGLAAGHYRMVGNGWRPLKRGETPRDDDVHLMECRRVLYRLPDLAKAPPDRPVFVVEGEKDVETLRGLELLATTNAMGAGKWRKEYGDALRDRHVIVLPDNDEAGRNHAKTVAKMLAGVAASVTVVELPGLPDKGDVTDWLALPGNDKARLLHLVKGAVQEITEAKRAAAHGPGKRAARKATPPEPFRPFPTEFLPQPMQAFVEQAAGAIGCDCSFVALPALAVAAALIGNSRVVRIKLGWKEPCVVWTCIIGESGTLKSPAIHAAAAPVYRLQEQQRGRHRADLDDYEQAKAAYEQRRRQARGDDRAFDEQPPDQPRLPRVVVSDVTVEKIAEVLEDNPRGVLLLRDELAGWFGSFTRYKGRQGGSDLPNWLEMHRAGVVMVDRKTGERPSLFVPRAAVSVTGGVQPGVLARALTADALEAGLGARVWLAMPPRGRKRWTENEVHPDVLDAYVRTMLALAELPFDQNERGEREPFAVRLTPEAKALWIAWFDEWAEQQAAVEGATAAAYAKLEGGAARLALLHSVVSHVAARADDCEPIGAESMAAGIAMAKWFAAESRRVYEALAESEDRRATRRLIEFIHTHDGRMTARRLHQSNQTRYPDAEAAEAALDALAEAGLGEWVDCPAGPKGGRPTEIAIK
jgi:hypothetical protein